MKSYEQDGYRRDDPSGQTGGRGLLVFVALSMLGLLVAMFMLGGLLMLKDEILGHAARSGNVLMVRLALDAGADVNAMNEPGLTPLGISAKSAGAEVAVVLMDAGADIHAPDAHGMTPLHHAATFGNTDMVDLLINAGADPSARDAQGYTPLMHAAASGYPWLVDTFASHGADVNAADTAGDTALLLASGYGRLNVVERLLALGADLNHQNAEGRTALHMALDEINPEVVAALIMAGARPDIPDGEGRTAQAMPGLESAGAAPQQAAPLQTVSRQTTAPRTPEVLGLGLEGMDDNAGGLVKAAFETRALKPTKGVVGNSLSMFGRVDFTLVEPMDFSDGYAISVWFWVSDQGGDAETTWTPVLSSNLMQVDLYDRYLRAYFAGNGDRVSFLELTSPAKGVEPNKWYLLSVAIDMDTAEAAVYLDGELLGMAPLENGVRGDLKFLRLGSMAGQNTPATFSGGFDELKVYRLTGGIKQFRKLVPGRT